MYMYVVDFPHIYIYVYSLHTYIYIYFILYTLRISWDPPKKRGLKICNYLAGFFLDLIVPLGFGDPNDS